MKTNDNPLNEHGENVLFVIGAGRSGTILLYKALCLPPDMAWISNYLTRFSENRIWPIPNRLAKHALQTMKLTWFGIDSSAYFNERSVLLKPVLIPVVGEPVFSRCDFSLHTSSGWKISQRQTNSLTKVFLQIRKAQGATLFVNKCYSQQPLHLLTDSGFVKSLVSIRNPIWQHYHCVNALGAMRQEQ